MKMKSPFLYLMVLVSATCMAGCGEIPETERDSTERITVGPGPEDMVLDTLHGSPRLLVSCTGRRESHKPYGEIESLDLSSGKRAILSRTGEPPELNFRPHGIYLDGQVLYVISHEREPDLHPVLVYRVREDRLEFMEMINSPLLHSPNALVTGPSGEVYVVNDSGKRGSMAEKALKMRRANVVRLARDDEGIMTGEVVAVKLGYPAGINRIGDTLFAGDAILHRIHLFRITGDGLEPAGEIRGVKGNDNLRIHQGEILTPGHVKPLRFIKHAGDPGKLSPVSVFMADPFTGQVETVFSTDGTLISAGSSAVIHGDYLYICQVFDPFILKVPLEP
jgi:hypothetical protein